MTFLEFVPRRAKIHWPDWGSLQWLNMLCLQVADTTRSGNNPQECDTVPHQREHSGGVKFNSSPNHEAVCFRWRSFEYLIKVQFCHQVTKVNNSLRTPFQRILCRLWGVDLCLPSGVWLHPWSGGNEKYYSAEQRLALHRTNDPSEYALGNTTSSLSSPYIWACDHYRASQSKHEHVTESRRNCINSGSDVAGGRRTRSQGCRTSSLPLQRPLLTIHTTPWICAFNSPTNTT